MLSASIFVFAPLYSQTRPSRIMNKQDIFTKKFSRSMGLMKRLLSEHLLDDMSEAHRYHELKERELSIKFLEVQLNIKQNNAMIKAAQNDGASSIAPSGTHVARCYQIIHIGTIADSFQGEPRMVNKVRIVFELPDCLTVFNQDKGEQPYSIGQDFTVSMHEKSGLRKFVQTWLGKSMTDREANDFDISTLLGRDCMLTVMHKESNQGKVFANIQGISSLMKGLVCPEPINEPFLLDYDQPDFESKLETLPEWLRAKVMSSKEYSFLKGGH